MIEFKNKTFVGSDNRLSVFDVEIPKAAKAVIIFVHGYKGFKDWGPRHLMQDFFIKNEFGFVKFNLSHNGGTVNEPIDFPDLPAFGRNTYSKELFDIDVIVTEVHRIIHQELELNLPIYLLGHSRGGGDVILHASTDDRIAKVVSLAGICDIETRFPTGDALEDWQIDGVRSDYNERTNQQMPIYYSMYEDFIQNTEALNIEAAARSLTIPFMQIHGDMDTAVSISEGIFIAEWTNTKLEIIKGADHTFGSAHPWTNKDLPEDLEVALEKTLDFFNKPTS